MENRFRELATEYADSGMVSDTSVGSLFQWLHLIYPECEKNIEDIYRFFIEEHTI